MNERDLKPVGMLVGEKWDKMHDISRRVYDENGVCPTIPTGAGGNTEVKIAVGAIRGRNPDNPSDRTAGAPTVQMLEIRGDECTNTITSVQKDNVVIETDARAETFPDDYIITIDGKPCLVRKLIPKECWRLFGFTDEQFETAKKALEEKHYHGKDKASSQLYKQAGNTIVIPMLAAVLRSIKGIQTKEVNS